VRLRPLDWVGVALAVAGFAVSLVVAVQVA
jgi:hypothetical protein